LEETHNSNSLKPANKLAASEHDSRVLSDNYVIIGPLGETDCSEVVIIRELSSGRHLLAKTITTSNEAVQERFHAAILEHGRLQQENIVQTVDWRTSDDGRPVLITEFLEGISLSDLIDEVGTLEDDDEITIFLFQLCDALQYAHSQNIIHGGLKPSNVVITKPDDAIIVKVVDFGAINRTRELPERPDIAGSPYLSPEQRNGEATFKSDVFSLAAVAYQLITGYLPFLKIDDGRVLDEAASELAPIFEYRPDIPEADKLGDVLARALDWDPAKRTATIHEFRKGLNDWYRSISSDSYEPEEDEEEDIASQAEAQNNLAAAAAVMEAAAQAASGVQKSLASAAETTAPPATPERVVVPVSAEWAPAVPKATKAPVSVPLDAATATGDRPPTTAEVIDDANFGDFEEDEPELQPVAHTTIETSSVQATPIDAVDDSEFEQFSAEDIETIARTSPETPSIEPVSEIGIIRRAPDVSRKQPGDPGYDEFEDVDDLDDLDEVNGEGEVTFTPPENPFSTSSSSVEPVHTATGFGADIADDEFGVADPDEQDISVPSTEIGNTPVFPSPGVDSDRARQLAELDGRASESTIPPDQEHSGRFSQVARLPALQAVPGMEASIAPPPVRIKTDTELEHDKENETIKKFKKPPKRQKSKLDSTMTKLMALRSNLVEQELTVSLKFSETFAQDGPRRSPKVVIARIVASVIIFIASSVLLVSNMSVLSSVWTVTSRTLSSMLLKKQPGETDTAIGTIETVIVDPAAKKTKAGTPDPTTATAQPQPGAAVNPNVAIARSKHQTNIIYVPRIIDHRNIAPKTMPAPGTTRYSGVVYPYLFTEEAAARDPKQPRATDSPVKEVTGQ